MTRVLQICVQLSAAKDSMQQNALFKLCVGKAELQRETKEKTEPSTFFVVSLYFHRSGLKHKVRIQVL